MIDPKLSQQRSDANEAAVKKQFEKLKYIASRLDTRGANKRRRPDFLISNSAGPVLLCEVKTVDSAFYPRDKAKYGVAHVHISTLDHKFVGSFQNVPIDLSTIDEALVKAISQRNALVEDHPQFSDLPLLIALFLDQMASGYDFAYPCSFDERSENFREVSGFLTIAHDVERNKAFGKLSDEEQEQHLRAQCEIADGLTPTARVRDDLPPHTTDFVLFRNEAANREVPEEFARQCLPPEALYT